MTSAQHLSVYVVEDMLLKYMYVDSEFVEVRSWSPDL